LVGLFYAIYYRFISEEYTRNNYEFWLDNFCINLFLTIHFTQFLFKLNTIFGWTFSQIVPPKFILNNILVGLFYAIYYRFISEEYTRNNYEFWLDNFCINLFLTIHFTQFLFKLNTIFGWTFSQIVPPKFILNNILVGLFYACEFIITLLYVSYYVIFLQNKHFSNFEFVKRKSVLRK